MSAHQAKPPFFARTVRLLAVPIIVFWGLVAVSTNTFIPQVERVADGIGVPLAAYLDLARVSLDDVAALGPAAALTGPVRRGDRATVAAHLAALAPEERAAYEALSQEAARLCP